ncbi:PQQ-dependent sugar dehydrogenase, partial [Acinetobacter sp. WU_MDCI_Abxc22]
MTELADGRLLITERRGKLKLYDPSSSQSIDILG